MKGEHAHGTSSRRSRPFRDPVRPGAGWPHARGLRCGCAGRTPGCRRQDTGKKPCRKWVLTRRGPRRAHVSSRPVPQFMLLDDVIEQSSTILRGTVLALEDVGEGVLTGSDGVRARRLPPPRHGARRYRAPGRPAPGRHDRRRAGLRSRRTSPRRRWRWGSTGSSSWTRMGGR